MSQFTKGKWRYYAESGEIIADDEYDLSIAKLILSGAYKTKYEYHANGRLIAEAPAMYDLLNKAFHILGKNVANDAICREIDECLSRVDGAPVQTEKGK